MKAANNSPRLHINRSLQTIQLILSLICDMPQKAFTFISFITLIFMTSCGKPKEDYSSYESSSKYIRATYSADVMKPSEKNIHKVEYYASSPEKWLLVFFNSNKSKGYIYKGVTAEMWKTWNASSSKDRWYTSNLKGNRTYFFKPHN